MKTLDPQNISYIQNHPKLTQDLETIIFIHGLQSSKDTFLSTIQSDLFTNFNCISIDQRGHGKTPPLGDSYTAESMAQDIYHFITFYNLSKIHLVGHSMGGRTAMAFLKLYPHLLKSITIEDMGAEIRQVPSALKDQKNLQLFNELRKLPVFYSTIEEISEVLSPLYSYSDSLIKRKVVKSKEGYSLSFSPSISVRYGYQANNLDYTHYLSTASVPIQFLQANPSIGIGSAMTEESIANIKKNIPNAKIEFFPSAWHSIHKSDATMFNEKLKNFILRSV